VFEASLYHVTNNRWCPICKNKTELKVYDYLITIYSDTQHGARFDWCRSESTTRYLPFDILLPSIKILVEIDGPQHFEDMEHFKSYCKERREMDHIKQNLARQNGFSVIRIVQEDVWNDLIDWKQQLIDGINLICSKSNPSIHYISGDNRYYQWHFGEDTVN
jgi:very-short-patch-repair endonuclease